MDKSEYTRRKQIKRDQLIEIMVEAGDIIPKGEGYYEDMGGHLNHESNLDGHVEAYLKSLSMKERMELMKRLEFEEANYE